MPDQGDLFGSSGRVESQEILEALEVDYTPVGVALQQCLTIVETYKWMLRPHAGPTIRVLCPTAGSGAWVRCIRAALEDIGCRAHITAMDARESERANLERAADRVVIGRFPEDAPAELFDIVIDNIPFSGFADRWHVKCRDLGIVRTGGIVAFYGLTSWGQGEESVAALKEWTPETALRAGGRVAHRPIGEMRWSKIPKKRRVPGGPTHEWRESTSYMQDVSVWIWRDPGTSLVWTTHQLPVLPADLRRWEKGSEPGTYAIERPLIDRVKEYL